VNTIFYNGVIKTLDNAYPEVSALWVKDGVILRAGSDDEILALSDETTKKVDLGGKLALPGFCDTHMHLGFFGITSRRIDLADAKSWAEVVETCKKDAEKARKNNGWIVCSSFNQDYWSDTNKMPDRHDLDAIAEDVPIYMQRACGHIACCNTKALRLSELWNERKETTVHKMDFEEDGTPNGYIRENTAFIPQNYFGVYTLEQKKDMIEEAAQKALAKGLVQVHSHDFNMFGRDLQENLTAFKELVAEGRLPIRVYEQNYTKDMDQLEEFLSLGYKQNDSIGRFKFGPIKIVADGSLGSHSAAMREPYKNDPDTKGILLYTDEDAEAICERAMSAGYDFVAHCIGDGALEQILNAIEKGRVKYPRVNARDGIIHCQIMDARQQERFKEMDMVAYVQPIFVKADGLVVDTCVGEELGKQSYNWRRYIDLGVHMCGGSDCPIEPFDPLPGLYYAVTRKTQKGDVWNPENGVTLDEAVRMFTVEAAYASHDEATRGTLGVGKYCDMVVLDKNIYEIDVEEILNTSVIMTIVDGEVAYEK